MEYTVLGKTQLRVSRIGMGCEQLGGTDWGDFDRSLARSAVMRALDLGINVFDTADVYGLGRSETVLSDALGESRHEVVIVTKFGVNWSGGNHAQRAKTYVDASSRRVTQALEASLKRLRLDCIPVYLVHNPDGKTPLEETMAALRRCQETGKVRYVGVSNFPGSLIERADQNLALSAVQTRYSLIDPGAEETVFPCCRRLKIPVLVYGVLAAGLLTGKYSGSSQFPLSDRRHRLPSFKAGAWGKYEGLLTLLIKLGRTYRKTPAQVALNWALGNEDVACAIVGAKFPRQVEENASAQGWALEERHRSMLESALPAETRVDLNES